MTVLAEKMKSAGVDTLGSQLTAACFEAIRQNPGSAIHAWNAVGQSFGYEFVRGLMADMTQQRVAVPAALPMPKYEYQKDGPGSCSSSSYSSSWPAPHPFPIADTVAKLEVKPYQPRVIPKERIEKRHKLQQIVRSKYLNSGGISWSDVGIHEGMALVRDGKEAAALNAALPVGIPNDGKTYGDVLGVRRVDEIIEKARG